MIHPYISYAPKEKKKNIGWAYNNFMKMIGEDDWACFVDHDAIFTIPNWYPVLEEVVYEIENGRESNRSVGLLTAVTNRIGNVEQILFSKTSDEAKNHDMYFHRKIGQEQYRKYGLGVLQANNLISGILMLTSKKAWKKSGGFKDGFLGVDNDYDKKIRNAGYRTLILQGIYMYHWYRANPKPGELQGWGYPTSTNLPPFQ